MVLTKEVLTFDDDVPAKTSVVSETLLQ